jgi:hypothetical protein
MGVQGRKFRFLRSGLAWLTSAWVPGYRVTAAVRDVTVSSLGSSGVLGVNVYKQLGMSQEAIQIKKRSA